MLKDIYKKNIDAIQDKIYDYSTSRLKPSEWVEQNIYLTSAESTFAGFLSYDRSPYTREVADCYDPNSDVECFAVMKCSQSGFTATVVTSVIAFIISQHPSNILFLSGSESLVQDTIRDRLDPIIQNSGLSHLIRPNVIKKKNQKSGDTDFKKEFAGGSLTSSTYNPRHLRFYSIKYVFADEFDDAPRIDKKEGSIRSLVEARTKSFGASKKIGYISSPTIKNQSNIEEVYELGDKREWNWECPHCKTYIPIKWRIEKEDGVFAGIKWDLDSNSELIPESVHYECQNCSGKINYSEKYNLNLTGKWIPTVKPKNPKFRSYKFNALCIPPGFDSWNDLVIQWLDACPPNGVVDDSKLKTFINTQLGEVWEDKGKSIKVSELMNNTRSYNIGVVPDETCKNDGNGKLVLVTMAVDLGGVMNEDIEDVRLDWEIVGHATNGQIYHINHGSIGTFKRGRKKEKAEIKDDTDRDKWTYSHGQKFSVWNELSKIIETGLKSESGDLYSIDMTVIDTGHFTRLAYEFIEKENNPFIVGIKGYAEDEYRKISKDTPIISRSRESYGKLFILQVNQLKDILASNIKLRMGMDGYQPSGFMNFPQPEQGKYTMRGYFSHLEAEKRDPLVKNGVEVGFSWKKKSTSVENHFFDVCVYNLAAKEIYIDILRRSDSKYNRLTFDEFVQMIE